MREREQWRPMRSTQLAEGGADANADVASARVVDIEDVEDFLVDLGAQLVLTHRMSLSVEKHSASSQVRCLCDMLCCLKNLPSGLSAEQTLMHDDCIHTFIKYAAYIACLAAVLCLKAGVTVLVLNYQ